MKKLNKSDIIELINQYSERIELLKSGSNYAESFNITVVATLRGVIEDLENLLKDINERNWPNVTKNILRFIYE